MCVRTLSPEGLPDGVIFRGGSSMLAFVQFPIADLRRFRADGGSQLQRPDWPLSTGIGLPAPFVRSFGQARRRWRGADYAFLDEQTFCGAARALKFVKLPADGGRVSYLLNCAFRRLFFDGLSVARVEVGLGYTETPEVNRYDGWDDIDHDASDRNEDPFTVLDTILSLETTVPYSRGKRGSEPSNQTRSLILQGPHLARLYAQATTKEPGANDKRVVYDLVAPCNPLVIIECNAPQLNVLPKRFVRLESGRIGGVQLAFGRVRRFGGDLGIWIAAYDNASFKMMRSVRLCLARLHAEQEVLQAALAKLSSGALVHKSGELASEVLERYLNRATRAVNRTNWAGIEQSAISEAFEAAEATQERQKIAYLRETLTGARQQIIRKVEAFERAMERRNVTNLYVERVEEVVMEKKTINIGAGATVNAPVVMAEKIENSFNTLAAAKTDENVKALMTELLKQVAEAGNAMPKEAADELARDAETLTKEVTSAAPRRKWYEFSIENLKQAATAVGDVGVPILKTAGKLLPLLLALFP
jgi:hypothetical protein